MPIITKPQSFILKNNIAIIGNELILSENGCLPSGTQMKSFVDSNLAEDWFSEDLYGYNALLFKEDALLPKNFSKCAIRKFFFEKPESTFLAARAKSILAQRKMYIFCPTCGTALEDDKTESALFCPSCKIKFFPRIEPATITLISRGDEILLARGNRGTYNKFACISGFVEQGETLEECVAREVKEETNLEVKNIKYAGSRAWPFPDQLMVEFTADYAGGELKIQEDEILEAQWFKRDNLPPLDQLPSPGSSAYSLIFGNANK